MPQVYNRGTGTIDELACDIRMQRKARGLGVREGALVLAGSGGHAGLPRLIGIPKAFGNMPFRRAL